jgi:hypothetical protein
MYCLTIIFTLLLFSGAFKITKPSNHKVCLLYEFNCVEDGCRDLFKTSQ